MPKLADTMTEGTLVKWRKKVGDKVSVGDVVADVETDKATMEMESFDDGTLHEFLVKEGQKVAIGAKLAVLLSKGEQPPAPGSVPPPAAAKAGAAAASAPAAPAVAAVAASVQAAGGSARSAGGRVKSSPLARKIAAERGLDIAQLAGTGPGGRIVAKDVQSAQARPAAAASGAAPIAYATAGEGDEVIALSGMRRIIAERLLASKTQIPHFYLHLEVDAGPLMKMRAQLNAGGEAAGATKLTVNDFILKAVVAAAVKVPAVNASFAGDSVIQFSSVSPSQNLVLSLNSNSVLLSISLLSSWTYFVPLYFAPLYVRVTPVNGILFIASFGTIP